VLPVLRLLPPLAPLLRDLPRGPALGPL